jgi:hypothetical protein
VTSRHVRRVVAGALLVGLLGALLAAFHGRLTREMPDFEVYWRAAVRARAAEPLYRVEDQHYQFKYLPAFAVLAVPVGLLPLRAAKVVWLAVSVALLVALQALGLAMLPARRRPAWVLVVATLVVMGKFYGHELVLGQVNLLLAAVLASAVVLMRRGREGPAGALVALAILIKPYAVLFLPWLAVRRRPLALVVSIAGLAAIVVLPAAVYGLAGDVALHRAWWTTVTTSTAPNLLNQDNVSLAALFAKWMGPGAAASRLTALAALVLLAVAGRVVARRRGRPFPQALEAARLLTLCVL